MHVPNTTALIFAMGYQGGTVHQVAGSLGVDVSDILNADADRMDDLLRLAQARESEAETASEDFTNSHGDYIRESADA